MGSLSFNPQYGDQRFDVNFLAGSLSGLAFKARRLQGLSLTTKQGVNSFSLMLGQLAGKNSKPFSSAVPRVLTLTGTLKPLNPDFRFGCGTVSADQSPRLDFRGSDARNPATEGDTLWVNDSTRRFSSRSMAF